ncbi:GNAT family N-acetyltransferase [Pseudoalteromonas luteoviolacea]|uniref:N-acetyltransferase domain-containing protein n=1 Tax=Pseudoalteromonas luteoviolacea DSM 6061 TaxID=1365250 RepID=A0A166YJP0_9GAMM|nr:GNAT family N-acetyltransferase [Pseudoalteromonas luteoviolacea]KZN42700.1 hypothetical protein N475_10245 [Pseudoalteromonas luteoviolacea DSM 6061]KZN59902.1 hypothetical protein N474_05780 [Pseudoalteromonas luteoviolacea CPMOR-2]MBE0385104.1 hypothetical protein [Pseudoalteromonas luteoviolacea DSM 6061]TQF69763.1 GNAT family N-acetyltransferase [Pseudoalteromonas luteoviolacea]
MTLCCYCLPAIQTPLVNKFFQAHRVRGRATKQDQVWVIKQSVLIAACRVQSVDNHAFLSTVFVDSAFRGQGIAKMLLQQVVEHAEQKIYTFAYHDVAQLYVKLNFEYIDSQLLPNALLKKFEIYTKQGRNITPMCYSGKMH